MHFQEATRIKSLKKTFFNVWSGRKRVFMHLCVLPDHQNQVLKKLFFSPLEWLKMCFDAFPGHQNQVLTKDFFNVWSGRKRVFMHLCVLPDHQNQFLKKWFKRVLMHFQTTRFKSLKNDFLTSGEVKNVFLCISTPQDSSP
jgi:hypothetical protein